MYYPPHWLVQNFDFSHPAKFRAKTDYEKCSCRMKKVKRENKETRQ